MSGFGVEEKWVGEAPPANVFDSMRESTFGDAPPVWMLSDPRQEPEVMERVGDRLAVFSARPPRRHPGGFSFWPRDHPGEPVDPGMREELLAVCQSADDRRFTVTFSEDPDSSEVFVIESTIPDVEWPVLGPGGSLTIIDDGQSLRGSLVIRLRRSILERESVLVDPEVIQRRLEDMHDLRDATVWPAFGYFEASRARFQTLLRPVYLFVIDRPQPPGRGVGMRAVVVEPATSVEGLEPWQGLEEWWEEV